MSKQHKDAGPELPLAGQVVTETVDTHTGSEPVPYEADKVAPVQVMDARHEVMAVLQTAVKNGATVETLERLFALRQQVQADTSRREFFTAMGKFQSECPPIHKPKEVQTNSGKHLYSYAPLEIILGTIRECEQRNGFYHSWDQEDLQDGGIRIKCKISHVGGHTETSEVSIPVTKGMNTSAAQDRGIMITYGQRRSLLNAYGIAPQDEDTDGKDQVPVENVTAEQVEDLRRLLKARNRSDSNVLSWASSQCNRKIAKLEEMPAELYAEAVRVLSKGSSGQGG